MKTDRDAFYRWMVLLWLTFGCSLSIEARSASEAVFLGVLGAEVDLNDIENISVFLASKRPEEIIDGLKSLRGLNAHEATPKILELVAITNLSPNIYRDACRTLAVAGTKKCIPSIEPLLNHSPKSVRSDAQEAISKLREIEVAPSPIRSRIPSGKRVQGSKSTGTGFIVASGGYVLTCEHVVGRSTNIHLRDVNGILHPA